jgi:tRNA threonylcarbamoyl adenosine modification protein YeaZ
MAVLILESSSPQASWAWMDAQGNITAEGSTQARASGGLFASLAGGMPQGAVPDRILVGVGPGSFSGVRVAVAAAQGLARVWQCPVEGVRSTHAVARVLPEVSFLGVFADAKRGQIFFTGYEHGRMTQASRLIPADALEAHRASCSRAVACGPLPGVPECVLPTAAELGRFWHQGTSEPGLPLEPIYLHESVVPGKVP